MNISETKIDQMDRFL